MGRDYPGADISPRRDGICHEGSHIGRGVLTSSLALCSLDGSLCNGQRGASSSQCSISYALEVLASPFRRSFRALKGESSVESSVWRNPTDDVQNQA